MLTTLRFLFLLMLGLLGFQPFSYAYDADGFVSSAEQCTYVPTTHSHVSSAETVASVPLCLDRDRAASASQANMRPTENSIAAETAGAGDSALLEQYLNGSGGRWGGTGTRLLNDSVATDLENSGYTVTGGAGRASEEWIPGPGGGTSGGTFVDVTAFNGTSTIRVQTITTLSDGVTPTASEAAAAARIQAAFPNDQLILVPK